MFEALDIFYIVLAFCVLWLTIAFFWLIWQVASILRNVNDTLAAARDAIDKIEVAITALKDRFTTGMGAMKMAGETALKVIDYAVEKKNARAVKKSEKKPKK